MNKLKEWFNNREEIRLLKKNNKLMEEDAIRQLQQKDAEIIRLGQYGQHHLQRLRNYEKEVAELLQENSNLKDKNIELKENFSDRKSFGLDENEYIIRPTTHKSRNIKVIKGRTDITYKVSGVIINSSVDKKMEER